MNVDAKPKVETVANDKTIRWSCRDGEFVLWVWTNSFLTSDQRSSWIIRDFWEMRDGDFVTITNRLVDLPPWFELHPGEVAGDAAIETMKRLKNGYQPKEPIEGPNIWRVTAGDRLAWVRTNRAGPPVREILTLRSCALVIGETSSLSSQSLVIFGAPKSNILSPADGAAMRAGFDAATALGAPREFAAVWKFGI